MNALTIEGLSIVYGRTEAVHGVALSVKQGATVCLIGANGAGKTTIMRTISGLKRPRAGKISFHGTDITGWKPHRIAALGLIQVPEGRQIFAQATVLENLELGAWLVPHAAERAARLDRVLSRFPRLAERRAQLAGSMSGGEQQMLALGRALMAQPKLLLLDEPSMGLAPLVVEEIFAILSELKRDGVTILVVEQNASAALDIADEAYVLETGRITLHGAASVVANDPAVMRAYLGG